jgi:hypothetical protein
VELGASLLGVLFIEHYEVIDSTDVFALIIRVDRV